jgi:hypothetical protein
MKRSRIRLLVTRPHVVAYDLRSRYVEGYMHMTSLVLRICLKHDYYKSLPVSIAFEL